MYKGEGLSEESSSCKYVGIENGGIGTLVVYCEEEICAGSSNVAVCGPFIALVFFDESGLGGSLVVSDNFVLRFSGNEFVFCNGVVNERVDDFGLVVVNTCIAQFVLGSAARVFVILFSPIDVMAPS